MVAVALSLYRISTACLGRPPSWCQLRLAGAGYELQVGGQPLGIWLQRAPSDEAAGQRLLVHELELFEWVAVVRQVQEGPGGVRETQDPFNVQFVRCQLRFVQGDVG